MPQDAPELFGLPANIDSLRQRTVSNMVRLERHHAAHSVLQVLGQLKVLMREDSSAATVDREAWSRELTPLMNQWHKLLQAWRVRYPCWC